MRVLIGLLKGGIIGGGLGFGFTQLGSLSHVGALQYLLYGVIGLLVGVVAGRPIWRQETLWTPLIKGVVGFALCIGLYALIMKFVGDPELSFLGSGVHLSSVPYALGAACGMAYGIFVEVDDGGGGEGAGKKQTDKEHRGGGRRKKGGSA